MKASRKEEAKGEIKLAADRPPKGIRVKPVVIPTDKDEATITLAVSKPAAVGLRQNIIILGTMKADKQTITHFVPAIPIRVVAAKQQ